MWIYYKRESNIDLINLGGSKFKIILKDEDKSGSAEWYQVALRAAGAQVYRGARGKYDHSNVDREQKRGGGFNPYVDNGGTVVAVAG